MRRINIIVLSFTFLFISSQIAFAQSFHNRPPKFVEVPDSIMTGSHCDFFQTTVKAESRVLFPEAGVGAIRYKMISGPGEVDARTGVWTYYPSIEESGDTQTVVIAAVQGKLITVGSDACEFQVVAEDSPPQIGLIHYDCGVTFEQPAPGLFSQPVYVHDEDGCDRSRVYISNVSPEPEGTYSLKPWDVEIDFQESDANKVFHVTISIVNRYSRADCDFYISTYIEPPSEPFEIQIEKTHNTFQGGHEYVDITVNKGSEKMLGFDLLIAYDASALSFQTATEGPIYEDCEWEYFTYRYGANGNCGDDCPSGLIRIVGLAETNNGPYHPTCFGPSPYTLFTIDFLVTNDRTYECQYVPIRFFWTDCGDNSVLYIDPDNPYNNPYYNILGISDSVYEFEGASITLYDSEFPTYFGAPTVPCMEGGDVPTRFIDFINGGIDIACAESVDARGDLNLNGIANEIADAVLYSNYFVYGVGVFTNYEAQVAASDVNANGVPLTVSDFVYLINIIRGTAILYKDTTEVDTAQVYVVDNKLRIWGAPIGAVYAVVQGNVTPYLIDDQMDFKYAYDLDNNVTRMLVYSFDGAVFYGGDLLYIGEGNLQSVEMATDEGRDILEVIVPLNEFSQPTNYPNPFNNETVITFDIPKSQDIRFEIYNALGQKIYDLNKYYDAGQVNIRWAGVNNNGQNVASGVYFYRIITSDEVKTNKMILLK